MMQKINLSIGDCASLSKTLTEEDVNGFSRISGDFNPVHMDPDRSVYGKRMCHGMLVASLISAVLGTVLPGNGTIYLEQTIHFLKPVFIGDTITANVEILDMRDCRSGQIVTLKTEIWNQDKQTVISGQAKVMVPK